MRVNNEERTGEKLRVFEGNTRYGGGIWSASGLRLNTRDIISVVSNLYPLLFPS